MKNAFNKIAITFLLIALLPISFVVYELTSWNDNEELIRNIYRNQLEALLFSVNQYSDDLVSSWANKVSSAVGKGNVVNKESVLQALADQRPVEQIFLSGSNGGWLVSRDSLGGGDLKKWLGQYFKDNEGVVEKLKRYEEAGFRKLEAIDSLPVNDKVAVSFITSESKDLAVLVIDLPLFIREVLGPKMQEIAQDKFIISAFRARNDSLVYSSAVDPVSQQALLRNMTQAKKEWEQKPFWLLPGYYLAISTKGATIDDFVRERQRTSLYVLLLLVIIVVAGIVFLYRNVKREIYLSQAKSEFVSNVSHEIRTPLSLISMYTETLEMGRVPEEKKREYYGIILKETNRLSKIVNRILNFSQAESNKKKYRYDKILLNDLVRETVNGFIVPYNDKGFTFELNLSEEVRAVAGDRESITEALINLLDNAVKYSKERRHIVVKTGIEKTCQFVQVTDQGIGIARKHQRDIFDQFFRAPTGDIHDIKGSGLGLALVKKTMEAHHGKVVVESEPGKGSTFRLLFPMK
jgi:two-component system, OmpR family, phosphate regulon sensor histidine kinase PhoR